MSNLNLPHKVEKPWGWELWVALTNFYVGKILHINPGHTLSLQYHKEKDESIFVLKGILEVEIREDSKVKRFKLKKNSCLRIHPGTIHRFSSKKGCELMEVSTSQLEDVVRLEDKYGRVK